MKGALDSILSFLFGCSHRQMGFPITRGKRTYRVCCDCGAELDYSWTTMSYVPARSAEPTPLPIREPLALPASLPRAS
jgi:hypothetical protein